MDTLLFAPMQLRDMTTINRIVVAPMCMYRAKDGVVGEWHKVHLGQFAIGGAGLIIAEATAVQPEGRITPYCPGLWNDAQAEAYGDVVRFVKSESQAKIGVQLAHAGRKASTLPPWMGFGPAEGEQAWQTYGPSDTSYLPSWPAPLAMSQEQIAKTIEAFGAAAKRAVNAGFELIEIHAAHGYLLHQFLSPLSNERTDQYGGDLSGRMRLTLEVFRAVRAATPQEIPVIVRVSATDWVEGGWNVEETAILSQELRDLGCDAIHVSTGGLDSRQDIKVGPGYQVEYAHKIREATKMPVIAVGQIDSGVQAETILRSGQADMIGIARGMLWNPHWAWHAALELRQDLSLPASYARCHPQMRAKPFVLRK